MATSEDVNLATRWILEQMQQDQAERREWHTESMAAYNKRTKAIDGALLYWLIVRTAVEFAIFISLILVWSAM